jgi:acylphosphatase
MTDVPAKTAAVHLFVSGYVQGVGFRFYVERVANELGVVGYVRNLPNGRVEVEAEGPKARLADLIEQVRRGPRAARVSDVEIEWTAPSGDFDSFSLRW